MKRVLTMTMNPCIDRTLFFSHFRSGETNYVDKVIEEAAGKGINAAVALAHIHVPVKAMGFAYKENANSLYEKLNAEQIPYEFVELEGKMRVNQKLFDKSCMEMTECNERGREVSREDVEKLLKLLQNELREASVLVLGGSVPPGAEDTIYARMIHMAKEAGVLTVLDASGKLMREGIKEKPYLIKPNLEEFIDSFLYEETEKVTEEKIEKTAMQLVTEGIENVCISLGKEGMLLVNHDGAWKYPAIETEVKSLQGAGDAMVAGLCKAIYENKKDKMAEYALRMAASTISLEGSRMGYLD